MCCKDVTQVPYIKLEAHLETCPLQVVTCRYACTGCSKTLPRCEMNAHEDDASVHMRGLLDCFVAERAAAHATITALQQQLAIAHANIAELRTSSARQVAELKGCLPKQFLFSIPYRHQGKLADFDSAPFGHDFVMSISGGHTITVNQKGNSWRGCVIIELRRTIQQKDPYHRPQKQQEPYIRLGSMLLPLDASVTINIPEDTSFVFWGNSRELRSHWPSTQQDVANAAYQISLTFMEEKEVKAHSK